MTLKVIGFYYNFIHCTIGLSSSSLSGPFKNLSKLPKHPYKHGTKKTFRAAVSVLDKLKENNMNVDFIVK